MDEQVEGKKTPISITVSEETLRIVNKIKNLSGITKSRIYEDAVRKVFLVDPLDASKGLKEQSQWLIKGN